MMSCLAYAGAGKYYTVPQCAIWLYMGPRLPRLEESCAGELELVVEPLSGLLLSLAGDASALCCACVTGNVYIEMSSYGMCAWFAMQVMARLSGLDNNEMLCDFQAYLAKLE